MSSLYQNVYITLEDGRVGMFSGPVLVTENDATIKVKELGFGLPKELPDGLTWEQLRQEVSMEKIQNEFNPPT